MKKPIYALLCLAILLMANSSFAIETDAGGTVQKENSGTLSQEEIYAFPVIKPTLSLFGGYRFVSLDGSATADEYDFLHNSIVLGGELRLFSFPHRLHLDMNRQNEKDYFGDLTYMYKDIVHLRVTGTSLYHNLNNIELIDLDPATPSPGVDVRDSGVIYGTRFGMSNAFLRFKAPDYPLHVYLLGSIIERNGTRQQMTLLGSGYFNDIVRTSQSRGIDQDTENLVIGANSHLGPVEIDFSHGEKRFKEEVNKVLYDFYTASPPRAAGEFPHNLVPDLRGSSNTIKLHTSYTGSLVASATLSKIDRENTDSGAQAGYLLGAGEISWTRSPRMAFFLKYRHRETDSNTPAAVTITDRTNPFNSYTYSVKPSLSSVTDRIAAVVRYRPANGVTITGKYSYESIRRSESAAWDLPESTEKNSALLSADLRILKGAYIRAAYVHKFNNDPAYNTDPDRSDEGKLSVSVSPYPRLTALMSLAVAAERREDLRFADLSEGGSRDVHREGILGSVTYLLLEDLSLTASYAYMHYKIIQDIAYQDDQGILQTDPLVPDSQLMHNYGLDVAYLPKNNISLGAAVSYTISGGAFYPTDANLLTPVSIASFSELKTRDVICSLSGEYRFRGGFELGIQYRFNDLTDVLDNPYDDVEDGKVHTVLLTLSKRW